MQTPRLSAARRASLARYCEQAQRIILSRQDAHTGLLPASTAVTLHGDYTHAWVRDNVYSILAVWALALACRRADPPRAAAFEAGVVRLMRGLLAAMMKQAHKVERFKHTQAPVDALHAKYDTHTGEPVVGDSEWGHLQIDATAIFLLELAQMSAAGLRIVHNMQELCFVQNLVHYLAKAYRTPDFGIWERGHKRNDGVAEVNASSVGMAKAALAAVSGFRFLGDAGPAVHVVHDDIARARVTLEGLLPRESSSKEVDAALLAVIGFPAFAVEDPALLARTRAEIVSKLQGRYGCKRFLRDGHQTVLEDPGRMHYEPGELRRFEHIESEWPLFFTYLLIDAALRGDAKAAADYRTRLDTLMQARDGEQLLPELYFVPAEAVEAERAQPQSQDRVPNENVPLVWAQSLYLVGVLLQEGWITGADLSPVSQLSAGLAQAVDASGPVTLRVALLAEDELVKSRLFSQGITAPTLAEAAPIEVRPARQLEAAFGELGRCEVLGLSGRPPHRLGSLATSPCFTLGERRLVFLPAFLDRASHYLALDNRLLVDEIVAEAAFVRRHWRHPGQPLLTLVMAEPMLDAPGADVLLRFVQSLARGEVEGFETGTLSECFEAGFSTAIDWAAPLPGEVPVPAMPPEVEAVLTWEEAATRPLTAARAAALEHEADAAVLCTQLAGSRNPYEQIGVLGLLWHRHGPDLPLPLGGNVRRMTEAICARAARRRLWGVLRRAAGLLQLLDETVEEAVAQIVVHGKRIAIGRTPDAAATISHPCSNTDFAALLLQHGGDDARGRALIQEVVLLLGTLIKADPQLFKGTLTLRAWHLVLLINAWLAREHGVTQAEAFDHLLDLSPHAILGRLREVVSREQEMTHNLTQLQALPRDAGGGQLVYILFTPADDPPLVTGNPPSAGDQWRVWRDLTGVMTRVPADFYTRVWELLHHCRGLVIGEPLDARSALDSSAVHADTTAAEPAFALQVEDLLNRIHEPAYRQLSIEALQVVSQICRANPGLHIDGPLVIDVLLATAVRLGWQGQPGAIEGENPETETEPDMAEAWQGFYARPPHQVAGLVMEAFAELLRDEPPADPPVEQQKETT